ncbi:MAG: hypothetical protein U1F50_02725 [Rubrivivax sp.]
MARPAASARPPRSAVAAAAPAGPPPIEVPLTPARWSLEPVRALAVPLAFVALLLAIGALSPVRERPALWGSFLGAGALLVAWAAGLAWRGRGRRRLVLEVVLRKQHYLQACAHLSIFAYWGWYWREVYDSAHLIVAQLAFAYAFDMLLSWSRRDDYTLGFGPFPIIFSTNLFLWFKPDWFYFQFLMVAVGFAAKELIRWKKDGRLVHVFNPSSFPLFLASLVLILTGTTSITWGQEIAFTFERPPYIRLWIFLAGLPGQFLFGVVSMTLSAVATVFGFGLLYHLVFGTYYFIDGFIPAAVFLGMHLLFTDPSTSPRSEQGRIIFGMLYGLAVIGLYSLLGLFGAPTFYDKLLAVPALNLLVQFIDRTVASGALRALDPARLGPALQGRKRNLAYMAVWGLVFLAMSDPLAAYRPRRWVPLWQQYCMEDRRNGCLILSRIEARYCNDGSGWACNELGLLEMTGRAPPTLGPRAFQLACARGFKAGCENVAQAQRPAGTLPQWQQAPPGLADYPILLQEGQGRVEGLTERELFEAACRQGWADGCARAATAPPPTR